MARAPTQMTDPAGNLVTTWYNDDGSVKETYTKVTNQDGTTTQTEKLANGTVKSVNTADASGNTIQRIYANDNGTIEVSGPRAADGSTTAKVYSGDGKTPLSTITTGADGGITTTYLNPDGSTKNTTSQTADQVGAAANKQVQANFDAQQADPNSDWYKTHQYNNGGGLGNGLLNFPGVGKSLGAVTGPVKNYLSGAASSAAGNGITDPSTASVTPGPGTTMPTPNVTMPVNVGGTANRTGTQAAAPVPITAPTNGFRAGLTAGSVDTQPAITSGAIQAGQSSAGQAGYAPAVQATSISAPSNGFKAGVTAGEVGVQGAIQSQQITAPQNTFKAGVTAGTVDKQAPIVGQQIGSTITPDQQQAIDLAKAQANGTAPSAAQALLQKGIDQNVGTAYGLAASLSGRNAGQALLQGSANAQTAIAKSSADMAALRAQEIAKGTETFGAFAGTAAGQELSAKQSNQATDLQSQISTATNAINVLTGNRDAALKAGLQNQADTLTAEIENQKEKLSALQSNQTADLTAKIQTVTNTINVLTGNRDAALKAGLQNQADTLQAQINDANNQLAALQSNQSTALAASTATSSNINAANIANAGYQTQSSIANAGNTTQANISTAANQLTAQIQTAQNNINVLTGNRDAALKAGQQNQADTLTAQINNANNQLDAMKSNLAATTQTNISNAGNSTALSGADLQAASAAMGLNSAQAIALQQMGLTAWVASLDSATKLQMANIVAQTAANSSNYELYGKLLGALGTIGAAYIASDRRLKTKVSDGSKDVGKFLDSLTASTWDYKDPKRDGPGRRLGIMAQDAGSTRMGRAFVLELPGRGGMLGLDPTKAIGPVLAGLASINARLKKVEGRRG